MAEETTRIINLTEATETDSGMYFVTDSSNGTKKVSIETLIDSTLEKDLAAAPAKQVGDNKAAIEVLQGQMETKANVDGAYEAMTVGNAEQLVSTVFTEDSVPYLFRTSGGSIDIGDREYDEIVGGTVVWNQLVNSTDTSVTVQSGHKYLSKISGTFALGSSDGTAITVDGANGDMVVDLTKFFGSATIPDYVYTLEQSTARSGVAWLRKYFPTLFEYHEYDAGTMVHVSGLQSHDMVGFNAWNGILQDGGIDNTTGQEASASGYKRSEYIDVIGGATYYFRRVDSTASAGRFHFYDANRNYLGNIGNVKNTTFTVPDNARYMRFALYQLVLAENDICINISWDGERNGEYEPYVKYSYPLDDSLILRGILKLDANNQLYYDGDTYEADGTVTRRYGIVDLGTLSWTYYADWNGGPTFYTNDLQGIIKWGTGNNTPPNWICVRYTTMSRQYLYDNIVNGMCPTGNDSAAQITIRDSNYTSASDVTAFKNSLSGTYLVYELATPTTETAEPYTNPQIVDDWGTEEYKTISIVPVGHNTKYAPNLRAKLEMLPDSPDGDGDYIVRQSNGQNAYAPLVIPNELPNSPTTDGTYVLKCTVSGGQATLSWEVEE